MLTSGPVSLDGLLAVNFGDFTPTGNDILFLVDNTGDQATTGAFQYPDNAKIATLGGFDWFITYDASDSASPSLDGGNDVALYSAVAVPEPAALSLLAAGLLGLLVFVRRKH